MDRFLLNADLSSKWRGTVAIWDVMSPAGHIWEAFQHQELLHSRYNALPGPLWELFLAVLGPGLPGKPRASARKRNKFLQAPVDSSRNKLSFCFLLVLIKTLNEGSNIFNRNIFFFLFDAAAYLDYLCWHTWKIDRIPNSKLQPISLHRLPDRVALELRVCLVNEKSAGSLLSNSHLQPGSRMLNWTGAPRQHCPCTLCPQ